MSESGNDEFFRPGSIKCHQLGPYRQYRLIVFNTRYKDANASLNSADGRMATEANSLLGA